MGKFSLGLTSLQGSVCIPGLLLINSNNISNDLLANFKKTEACNFTKSNTPPWVFFMFCKLHKYYQIAKTPHLDVIVLEIW